MYYLKLLVILLISSFLVLNPAVFAAQDKKFNELVVSGDIVLDEEVDSGLELLILENPEDVEAGAILTISVSLFLILAKKSGLILAGKAGKAAVAGKVGKAAVAGKAGKAGKATLAGKTGKKAATAALDAMTMDSIDKALDRMADAKRDGNEISLAEAFEGTSTEALLDSGAEGVKDEFNPIKKINPKDIYESIQGKADMLDDVITLSLGEYESGGEKGVYLPITGSLATGASLNPQSYGLAESFVSSELVKGGEFTDASDLNHWTSLNAKSGYSAFGDILSSASSSDQQFGFIHTGLGDSSDKGFMVQNVFPTKNSSAVFNARYNFVTTEFPKYLNSLFNDSFVIKIEDVNSGATKTLASFEGSLNELFKSSDPVVQNLPAQFLDEGKNGGGQTGWLVKSSDAISLKAGGQYRVYIDVRDVGDKVYDSALLIDKVSLR